MTQSCYGGYIEFSARKSKDGYKYQSEYINCLIALKDIRSLMIIEHNIETLTKNEENQRTEFDYEFQLFLIRRRCYCLIELKLYDQAEEGLQYLLKADPGNKFAAQEMEFIKAMKEK